MRSGAEGTRTPDPLHAIGIWIGPPKMVWTELVFYPHGLSAPRRVACRASTVRRMTNRLIFVDGVVPVEKTELDDVRAKVWSYALDQRAFGPRKLLVAFTEANGQLRVLAHANRTSRSLSSFEACLDYLGVCAAAAVAFCDQRVAAGPPSPEFLAHFDEGTRACPELRRASRRLVRVRRRPVSCGTFDHACCARTA
jgi:hypothetical protein